MVKRFLTATGLAAAILFSQSSNFLIAALCPHLQPEATHCKAPAAESLMSHHDIGQAQVHRSKTEPRTKPVASQVTLGVPKGLCSHCSLHSQTTSNAGTLRGTAPVQRTNDLTIPVSGPAPVSVAASPIAVVPSRAHGPPGNQTSRHILINIFRI